VFDDKYKKHRDEIDIIFHNDKNYMLCLEKTKEFLHMIKNEKAEESNFRFAYVTLSKTYNHLGDKMKALNNIIKARQYLKSSCETKKILIDWQTGMCYKGINNKKALIYFDICYMRSRNLKNFEFMGGVLDEIALIKEDINTMIQAIEFYKLANTLPHMNSQSGLDEMYSHLFLLYMKQNDILNAIKTLHNIKNKTMTNNLKLEVFKIA
jgi:hypothetical protein